MANEDLDQTFRQILRNVESAIADYENGDMEWGKLRAYIRGINDTLDAFGYRRHYEYYIEKNL